MRAYTINATPVDNTIAFRDLGVGEFLVSDTGNVGVVTKDRDILWVVVGRAGDKIGTQTLAQDVSHVKRYRQPVSVVVTV